MLRHLSSVGLAGFSLFLLAGCPVTGLGPGDADSDVGADQDRAGLSGGSTSGTGQAQPDELEQLFPGCGEPADAEAWRDRVLELLNSERRRYGLGALTRDPVLDAEAEQYACEMIHYDFFAHVNPVTGTDIAARAVDFGYDYWMIGENLAAGQTSPEQAVADWMASPGHRENMLQERYTEVGIGLRQGGDYGLYWVLEFGLPQ